LFFFFLYAVLCHSSHSRDIRTAGSNLEGRKE
jgi:hypothetical protein